MKYLQEIVDYWFTFRELSSLDDKVPSCLGCARKAKLAQQISEARHV